MSFLWETKYLTTVYLFMYICGTSASIRLLEDQATSSTRGSTNRNRRTNNKNNRGPPAREAERFLRRVERNLIALTRAVPMSEIEDLPPSMQPHVIGVPRTWVQLF